MSNRRLKTIYTYGARITLVSSTYSRIRDAILGFAISEAEDEMTEGLRW